jgi:hypothetical protein
MKISRWQDVLEFNPIPALVRSENMAIIFFTRRDLLNQDSGNIELLWELPESTKIVRKQQENGSWIYRGGNLKLRTQEEYDQIESYRSLGILVEKSGFNRKSIVIQKAAEYLFSCQTTAGDFRGIYGNQFSPNYSAGIMELLIKAGYSDDSRIEKGFRWLLSIRQNDQGWAIPFRTVNSKYEIKTLRGETILPDRSKPFSHLVTGVVLRAFSAHPIYKKSLEAKIAGELLLSRLFQKDKYPDRMASHFWLGFSYPFWFTDLLSSLDTLSQLNFPSNRTEIKNAVNWFVHKQRSNGLWKVRILKGQDKDLHFWLDLAICRVFKRFFS